MGITVINKPPVMIKRNQYGLLEDKNVNYVLSNSFAFGGNNTSILLGALQ